MSFETVKSKLIKEVSFVPGEKLLKVRFASGQEYHYEGVEQDAYDALMNAESIGSYFGKNIRGQFKHHMIEQEQKKHA